MSDRKPVVPKFGSFRPKQQVIEPKPEKQIRKKEQARDQGGLKRPQNHHNSIPESTGETEGKYEKKPRVTQILVGQTDTEGSELFVIDREGDEKNVIYGSVHRYSVPLFKRIGAGSILGIPNNIKIDRYLSNDREMVLENTRTSRTGTREKYAFSKLERPRLLRIRPDAQSEDVTRHLLDFVPLETPKSKKRKHSSHSPHSDLDSDHDVDYRSIHGKEKSSRPLDDAFEYASDSEGSDINREFSFTTAARQRNAELSRMVEVSPRDVDSWLTLIEHQDTLLRGEDDHRRITNAETRSTADIKIHLYEKALEKITIIADREKLLHGLMSEGSRIWEVKYQMDRWEGISKENINSLSLWKSYLDFKQTTFATFRHEEIRDVYLQRIKLLADVIKKNSKFELYQQLIYVLVRVYFLTF